MKKGMSLALFIVTTLVFVLWCGIRISSSLDMKNNCLGYLDRAANANSIELAEQNLTKAIEYLEKHDLTDGQVSIFLKQPKNDIGYWYKNLKVAQEQLQNVDNENIGNLEESNILMKLRETLTDNGSSGTKTIYPEGISVYPNNVSYFWMCILSMIGLCVFGIMTLCYWDE